MFTFIIDMAKVSFHSNGKLTKTGGKNERIWLISDIFGYEVDEGVLVMWILT